MRMLREERSYFVPPVFYIIANEKVILLCLARRISGGFAVDWRRICAAVVDIGFFAAEFAYGVNI